jgi:hypothetical protein
MFGQNAGILSVRITDEIVESFFEILKITLSHVLLDIIEEDCDDLVDG